MLHEPRRFYGAAGFTVFLKTDSSDKGKEAPVSGSRNPLFFDPSYPKHELVFEELTENATDEGIQFRICFSSRPYPYIDIHRGILPVRGTAKAQCQL
jgi:hypothetical protein